MPHGALAQVRWGNVTRCNRRRGSRPRPRGARQSRPARSQCRRVRARLSGTASASRRLPLHLRRNARDLALIELRIQLPDALEQRRMSRECPMQAFGKKHVGRLFRLRRGQHRAFGHGRNPDERFLQPLRVAGELHPRGIGQSLALARHGGLQQPAEEHSNIPQHHDRKSQHDDGVVVVAPIPRD